MMNVLQRFVLPGMDFPAADEMYARTDGNGVMLRRESSCVQFFKGAKFSFDTYFNGLTVDLWKRNCQVDSLDLFLEGRGRVLVRVAIHQLGCADRILDERELVLDGQSPEWIPVAAWPALAEGLLFVSVFALEDGEITGGGWATASEPRRTATLAVVVTHFNRRDYVLPAMRRLRAGLGEDPGRHIGLFVIDNSSNIDPAEVPEATVIANRNLGGSGGFSRGLLEAGDRAFSHCLFMDDDASCEVESVRRAYTLLCYAQRADLAVAGGLLREVEPNRLFEKGARFDGLCRPMKSGLDMNRVHDLLLAEQVDQYPDYGGWWFFAFKISQVKSMAFPFFVRGDDIMFSMMNDFQIVTANGIACWGDDFALKSGPMPIYLDVRNHLVQKMSHMGSGRFSVLLLATRFFVNAALSYNYATARAVSEAVRDVCKGESFWRENMDMAEVRARIGALTPSEKMEPMETAHYEPVSGSPKENPLRKLFRFATLNGFLLPGFLIKNDTVIQPKGFKGSFRELFRHRRVLYFYAPFNKGYTAVFDRSRFFKELLFFVKSLLALGTNYSSLRSEYRKSVREMTTRDFWNRVYSRHQ